ncbi:hypothetical protein MSG28_005445 [Choristoneura fumiferana]|uniref:Uncharacterized protein n=1 Tax=Choristoneura fumiferana TaxID=7141 RepID=A0ACC0KZJ7_CHOFU|nr:hypothetical protein MSG28_005445 [Choristoneura fumiferana]
MWRVVVLVVVGLAVGEELPEDFVRCRQKDPNLNDCLKAAIPDALRKMRKGIPALAVPPLEPLLVAAINIHSGAGPVVLSQNYRHIQLHGLASTILTTYKADLPHYRLITNSMTPKMEFIADYVMKGRILVLPIQGKGIANVTMVNLVVKHDLIGEPVVRNGQTYMHIREYKVKFLPKRVYLHFTNLFNGDKRLGDQMNLFLNENSELVFNELKESYEKSLSSVFKNVTNTIFDKVPMNKIFIED